MGIVQTGANEGRGRAGVMVPVPGFAMYQARLLQHNSYQVNEYSGPRGFLLFFLGKFCDANRFFYIFLMARCAESLWSLSCHQLLTVVSDWRIFLIALRVIWLDGLNIFGDVIGQNKMRFLTAVKCWASMKVRFSTILTRGLLFSRLGASISAWRSKLPKKKRILTESLWYQGSKWG